MPSLRWTLPVVLLIAAAALAAPRVLRDSGPTAGTDSAVAAEAFERGSSHLRRLEFDAALEALTEAIDADPGFAMAHFERGHVLVWLNRREEGLAEILAADSLAQSPGLTTELERLVIGHAAAPLQKDEARSEECYQELVLRYPDDPQSLRLQAQRAVSDGDILRARQLYTAVLDADPDRVEIHNTLGYLALHEGQYEDAINSFKRYAYYASDSANPHDSLGEAYLWTGRYHESLEEYTTALDIDPSFISSVLGATEALTVTGQFRLARKFLDNFEELFERRNQAGTRETKLLQLDYQAEDWPAVATTVERLRADDAFADFDPGARLWTNTLGAIALAELGRADESAVLASEAEESFDRLLGYVGGEDALVMEDLRLLRASLRCRLAIVTGGSAAGELAELRGLVEASAHRPHRLLAYQGVLIQSLYDAGLDAEALEIAPRVLAFNPNHPRTLLVCARAQARLHDPGSALVFLERYLDVMRDADASHPRVQLARELHARLAPSS